MSHGQYRFIQSSCWEFPLTIHFLLFIYLACAESQQQQGLLSSCGAWASYHGGFSLLWSTGSRARWFHQLWYVSSVVVTPRFESTGSTVVAHRLHYSMVHRIFPDRRSNPCLLHWQTDTLPLSHQGSPCGLYLIDKVQSSNFLSLGRLYSLRKTDSS